MDYKGSYSALIYEMMHKLENVATVPALNGGYLSEALEKEWRAAKNNLDFMYQLELLDEAELKEARCFLARAVDDVLICKMMHKLEDVATMPALNGGYPSVAILEEWQVARKSLGAMCHAGLLSEPELKEARCFLAGTVDEYLTKAQEEFMKAQELS